MYMLPSSSFFIRLSLFLVPLLPFLCSLCSMLLFLAQFVARLLVLFSTIVAARCFLRSAHACLVDACARLVYGCMFVCDRCRMRMLVYRSSHECINVLVCGRSCKCCRCRSRPLLLVCCCRFTYVYAVYTCAFINPTVRPETRPIVSVSFCRIVLSLTCFTRLSVLLLAHQIARLPTGKFKIAFRLFILFVVVTRRAVMISWISVYADDDQMNFSLFFHHVVNGNFQNDFTMCMMMQ